jgi:hypothetical protein
VAADVELEFVDDDPTPLPGDTRYKCFACPGIAAPLAPHIGPPTCEAEARAHYEQCAKGLAHAVCAAKFLLKIGPFTWYFGPERRARPRSAPG